MLLHLSLKLDKERLGKNVYLVHNSYHSSTDKWVSCLWA